MSLMCLMSDRLTVLTYDDMNVEEDGDGSSLQYNSPPPSYHSQQQHKPRGPGGHSDGHRGHDHKEHGDLPVVEMVKPAVTGSEQQVAPEVAAAMAAKKQKTKARELTDDERKAIVMQQDFQKFFDRATRIVERALYANETPDIFIDYAGAKEEMEGYVRHARHSSS